jgi:hypothetical protein
MTFGEARGARAVVRGWTLDADGLGTAATAILRNGDANDSKRISVTWNFTLVVNSGLKEG